jgi:hypothetical protein
MLRNLVSPDNPNHAALEADAVKALEDVGFFMLPSWTYHDVCDPGVKRDLSRSSDRTVLGIRTKSDRVARHPEVDWAFKLELKTMCDERYDNLAVEAYPLFKHRLDAIGKEQCLYVVRDFHPARPFEGAFWASTPLPPRTRLFYAARHEGIVNDILPSFTEDVIPVRRLQLGGSGDPCLIIERRHFPSFMIPGCWRSYVSGMVALRRLRNQQSLTEGNRPHSNQPTLFAHEDRP